MATAKAKPKQKNGAKRKSANKAKKLTAMDDWIDGREQLKAAGEPYDIWPGGKKLEVIGLTGDEGSGKTIWACSIDPERTLVIGFEKGAADYEDLGFDHVDARNELQGLHAKGYTPLQVFLWLESFLKSIEPGKYSVIIIDTIGDAEEGLAEFIATKHKEHGYKSADSFRSMGGVFWGAVSSYWKYLLADLSSRCQTFVYTSHLRAVWKDGKPTKRREPQGKRPLRQLASLCLWLYRDPNSEEAPTGEIHNNKMRLRVSDYIEGRLKHYPCLPPKMEHCTPDTIREYILDPVGKRPLKEAETIEAHDESLTGDERLELQSQIAADQRAAAEARLAASQEKSGTRVAVNTDNVVIPEVATTKDEPQKPPARKPRLKEEAKPNSEPAKSSDPPMKQKAAAAAASTNSDKPQLDGDLLKELAELKQQLNFDKVSWKNLLGSYKVASARDLSSDQATSLIKSLKKQFATEQGEIEGESAQGKELREWTEGAVAPNK